MSNRLKIPGSNDEITKEWLTEALRISGSIDSSKDVAALSARALDDSAGQTGWYSELAVEYSQPVDDPPRRLFVKGHQSGAELFAEATILMFEQELLFYGRVAPETNICVPQFYYGDVERDAGLAILILESLSQDQFVALEDGLSAQDAVLVVTELAGLHGRWWNSPEIDDLPWVGDPFQEVAKKHYEPYIPAVWKRLKSEAPQLLTPYARALGDDLAHRVAEVWAAMLACQRTLLQMDPRADNVAFRESSTGRVAVLFDWLVGPGPVAWDLGLLLFSSLDHSDVESFKPLLGKYCDRLAAEGVTGYSRDNAMNELRLGALSAFIARLFTMGAYLDLGADHPRSVKRGVAFERTSRWAESLDALSTLRSVAS